MNTIELFSGTKSFSKAARVAGHQTFTVDNNYKLKPDLVSDISLLTKEDFPFLPDILWCSPPCECFSVASIGHHWKVDKSPKTERAHQSLELIKQMLRLIDELDPTWVFIENPRGMLRKQNLLDEYNRQTVTYCQYGDTRMKPTDIWTNAYWWMPRPACKNGASCHVAAPRGSRSGTQGMKDAKQRGVIPSALFEDIFKQHVYSMKLAA